MDCLVTKCKGVVNNDNLPLFGKFKIELDFNKFGTPPPIDREFSIDIVPAEESILMHIDGGVWVSNDSSDLLVPVSTEPSGYGSPYKFVRTQLETTITIETKPMWALRLYQNWGSYANNVSDNVLKYVIKRLSITNIINNGIDFDTEFLSDRLAGVTINGQTESYTTTAKGSIESLSKCISLTSLDFVHSPLITGAIDNLGNMMVENSRTSGIIEIKCNGTITVNDVAVANGTTKWLKFGQSLPSGADVTGDGWAIYASNPDI